MRKSTGSGPIPSRAATSRLQRELRVELDTYRVTLAEDLTDVKLAERDGAHEDAIRTLEGHLAALETLQVRVAGVIAGAVAEREAESIIDAVAVVPPPPTVVPAPPSVTPPPPDVVPLAATGSSSDRPPAEQPMAAMRRGLVAAGAMVALVVAGLVSLPGQQTDPLLTAVTASEDALAAAQLAGRADADGFAELSLLSESLTQAIGDLPPEVLAEPEVRVWLGLVLTDQRTALLDLLDKMPEVGLLLSDLERLGESLGLTLSEVPSMVVPEVAEDASDDVDAWGPAGSGDDAEGQQNAPDPAPRDADAEADQPQDEAAPSPILPAPDNPGDTDQDDEPAEEPQDPSGPPLGLPDGDQELDDDPFGSFSQ